jgi:predicted RNA-binding Zn-ribbon protein involved in translation (DUF1610 family)
MASQTRPAWTPGMPFPSIHDFACPGCGEWHRHRVLKTSFADLGSNAKVREYQCPGCGAKHGRTSW